MRGKPGSVYHLGQDRGTTIHGNVCYNVSSFDYGGLGYYLDQASQFVTVTDNIAYDVKCAGFLQNFGLNCTISNNVLAATSQAIKIVSTIALRLLRLLACDCSS